MLNKEKLWFSIDKTFRFWLYKKQTIEIFQSLCTAACTGHRDSKFYVARKKGEIQDLFSELR